MATDNLMAGVTGFGTGVSDVLGKYFDSELKSKRRSRDLLEEQDIWEQRLPMQAASDIAVAKAKPVIPTYLIDREGAVTGQVGGKVSRQPVEKPQTMYQKTDAQGNLVGEPSTDKPVVLPKPNQERSGYSQDPGLEILTREAAKDLPKLRDTATTSKTSIGTINKAISLVDKGGVTGKGGQWKAFFAPYVELVGEVPEDISDAQAFQSLTRLIVGPLRLEIVGSGPVSDFEQKLIKELSGGGGTAKAAAKELLNYYKGIAKNKIKNYNSTVEGAATLDKRFNDLYKPVNPEDEIVPVDTDLEKKKSDLRKKLGLH